MGQEIFGQRGAILSARACSVYVLGKWTVAKASVDNDRPARLAASKTLFAAGVFETAIAHAFALNMRCLPHRSLVFRIKIRFLKFATAPWLTHSLLCACIHARLMNTFSCPNRFRRLMERPDCSDVPVKTWQRQSGFYAQIPAFIAAYLTRKALVAGYLSHKICIWLLCIYC